MKKLIEYNFLLFGNILVGSCAASSLEAASDQAKLLFPYYKDVQIRIKRIIQ